MLIRRFQLGLCGDWVEIYEQTPRPKNQGKFFLAFRKKFGRKVLPLMCGITAGGAKVLAESFKKPRGEDLTALCSLIARKLEGKCAEFVPLSSQ